MNMNTVNLTVSDVAKTTYKADVWIVEQYFL